MSGSGLARSIKGQNKTFKPLPRKTKKRHPPPPSKSLPPHPICSLEAHGLFTFSRCGFTPVSTVLRKSVRFFIINILLIIIKLPKLKSGKWSGQMFSFLQFPSIRCPLNESETRERELKGIKILKNTPRSLLPRPLV